MKKLQSSPSTSILNKAKLWFENNRTVFGLVLIFSILSAGAMYALSPSRAQAPTFDAQVQSLKKQNEELIAKLKDVEDKHNQLVAEFQNAKEEAEKQVAGETTESVSVKTITQNPSQTQAPTQSGKINLNTASASSLDSLPGIGPSYAKRIIDYRETNGGFKAIEEVMNVKGIGPKTFEKMKDKITI